jgi:hypothetical protein
VQLAAQAAAGQGDARRDATFMSSVSAVAVWLWAWRAKVVGVQINCGMCLTEKRGAMRELRLDATVMSSVSRSLVVDVAGEVSCFADFQVEFARLGYVRLAGHGKAAVGVSDPWESSTRQAV